MGIKDYEINRFLHLTDYLILTYLCIRFPPLYIAPRLVVNRDMSHQSGTYCTVPNHDGATLNSPPSRAFGSRFSVLESGIR